MLKKYFIFLLLGFSWVLFALPTVMAETNTAMGSKDVTVHKSPYWGCCKGWSSHLEKAGFKVTSIHSEDLDSIKEKYKIKPELQSCHTALIDGYIIEGHVPVEDIQRLLKERPKNIAGLATPGMPMGSPGMEGGRVDKYKVYSFDKKGTVRIFSKH